MRLRTTRFCPCLSPVFPQDYHPPIFSFFYWTTAETLPLIHTWYLISRFFSFSFFFKRIIFLSDTRLARNLVEAFVHSRRVMRVENRLKRSLFLFSAEKEKEKEGRGGGNDRIRHSDLSLSIRPIRAIRLAFHEGMATFLLSGVRRSIREFISWRMNFTDFVRNLPVRYAYNVRFAL